MSGLIDQMEQTIIAIVGSRQKAKAVVNALLCNFGGDRIYLPTENTDYRNEQIFQLAQAGAPPEALAKRFRLSRSTVYRIIKQRSLTSCVE